jgi:hypothetical protein
MISSFFLMVSVAIRYAFARISSLVDGDVTSGHADLGQNFVGVPPFETLGNRFSRSQHQGIESRFVDDFEVSDLTR